MMLLLALCTALFQDGRQAIPSEPDQTRAEKVIREILKEEFAKETPFALANLSKGLLRRAREPSEDLASRYVLYREAADLAVRAEKPEVALSAIGDLCREFRVDSALARTMLLSKMQPRLTRPESFRLLCEAYLQLLDDDQEHDDIDLGVRAASGAAAMADQAQDPALSDFVRERTSTFSATKAEFEVAQQAKAVLSASPADAEANGRLGTYLCLTKGAWGAGLPFLARSGDADVADLARRDLARPSDPEAQVSLGDGWWKRSGKETVPWRREVLIRRAAFWYRQALPRLEGAPRKEALLRVEDIDRQQEPSPQGMVARWTFNEEEGKEVRDSSGKGSHGTLEGGAVRILGVVGNAVGLDGKGAFVALKATWVPDAEAPVTIAWAERYEDYPRQTENVITLSDVPHNLSLSAGHREARVVVWKWGGVVLLSAQAPLAGSWHSYAYSFDGTIHKLYIDGFLKDQSMIPPQRGEYARAEVGRWQGPEGTDPKAFFKGSVDELRVYNRALSDQDIRKLARMN